MRIETRVMSATSGRSDGAPKAVVEIELTIKNGVVFPLSRNTTRELALRALMADQQLTDEYRQENYTYSDENFELLDKEVTDWHVVYRYEVKPDATPGVKYSGGVGIQKNNDGSYGVILPPARGKKVPIKVKYQK